MTLGTLFTTAVTVTPRAADVVEDDYGDEVLVGGTPANYLGRLEQFHTERGSLESLDGQDRVETNYTLYLPAGAAIGPLDMVTVDSVAYEVQGRPAVQSSPSGPHHIVATLRRIEGG